MVESEAQRASYIFRVVNSLNERCFIVSSNPDFTLILEFNLGHMHKCVRSPKDPYAVGYPEV